MLGRQPWIAGAETPDLIRGRNDNFCVIPDLIRDPAHAWHWIAGAETPDLIRGSNDKGRGNDNQPYNRHFFNFRLP